MLCDQERGDALLITHAAWERMSPFPFFFTNTAAVYGGAGLAANGAQLATNAYANMRRDPYFRTRSPRCLGASGAVNAAVAYGCLLNPWRMIIVFAEFLPLRRRPASVLFSVRASRWSRRWRTGGNSTSTPSTERKNGV